MNPMPAHTLRHMLSQRLSLHSVKDLAAITGIEYRLAAFISDSDTRIATNALWVLTHLPHPLSDWNDRLTRLLLQSGDTTRRRLLLTLIERIPVGPGNADPRIIDYCLPRITSETQPHGVRTLCVKCAYNHCRHYPELLRELSASLDLMSAQALSPALQSILRTTRRRIAATTQNT